MFPINLYYKEKLSSVDTFESFSDKYNKNILTEKEFNNLDSEYLEYMFTKGIKTYKDYIKNKESLLESSYKQYCFANRQAMLVEINSVDEFKLFLKECEDKDHILLMDDNTKNELLGKVVYDKSEKDFLKFFYKKK